MQGLPLIGYYLRFFGYFGGGMPSIPGEINGTL